MIASVYGTLGQLVGGFVALMFIGSMVAATIDHYKPKEGE